MPQQLIASVLSFIGLPVGRYLGTLAEDELEPGKPYLVALRAVVAALIVWFGTGQLSLLGQFSVTLGVVLILTRRGLFSLVYPLWGIILGLNLKHDAALLAGLVFLYGMVEAASRHQTDRLYLKTDLLFFPLLLIGMLL